MVNHPNISNFGIFAEIVGEIYLLRKVNLNEFALIKFVVYLYHNDDTPIFNANYK